MDLKQFQFTEHLIERFKNENHIPVNFYNRFGQILIHKKENASVHEVNQLLKFRDTGIYYDQNDYDTLTGKNRISHTTLNTQRYIPKGLTDTKLFSQQTADKLSRFTSDLFNRLKRESIDSVTARNIATMLADIFTDFSKQPDAMTGLLNILELMDASNDEYEVILAVKRTVISMALKTRGMLAINSEERNRLNDEITTVMIASLLSDIAFLKMDLPRDRKLTPQEYIKMKRHPLISYLMIANEHALPHNVKHLVLFQHYRQKDKPNNYPDMFLIQSELKKRLSKISDTALQLHALKTGAIYSHNANITGIASKFSYLTTPAPYRESYSAIEAVRAIINNATFTYSNQAIREFLDYSAISLCDNSEIIKSGDIIITETASFDGGKNYEICMVMESSRFQSRPVIKRFATLSPRIKTNPKTAFDDFNLLSIEPDKRHADIDLNRDNSRFIAYIIDSDHDPALFKAATSLISRT
ncbi:MAG: hypothetical protein JXK07_11325 [Spirochaetes bacterium]|nr:hypothetical protein [Spirochaetota bacterium]MBN2772457.1 hypothetical protein [Spirochaetota bacterium]